MMMFRQRIAVVAAIVGTLGAATHHVALAQHAAQRSACYRLTYDDSAHTELADFVALDLNGAHEARSGVERRRARDFWRMFLAGATWERAGDTLTLQFSNGFTSVVYTLRGNDGHGLRGVARIYYDVVGRPIPEERVTAAAIDCASAQLQSPIVTTAERARRREDERRSRFIAEETTRLAATPSPLAGTYRFELTLPGLARPLVVFGRTERAPYGPFWKLLGGDAFSIPAGKATPALGYQLRLIVAMDTTARSLAGGELAYFDVVDTARRTPDGRASWRGQTDVVFAVSRLVSEGRLDSLLTAVSHDVDSVWEEEAPGRIEGGWTTGPAGRVELAMRVERGGRTVLSMRGTRISRATAPLKE